MKIIEWFKKLRRIVRYYDLDNQALNEQMNEATELIRERTDISADIHLKGNHGDSIIVVGRYRNADYIKTFSIQTEDFQHTIEMLKEMEKYGKVKRIDAPPALRACILR